MTRSKGRGAAFAAIVALAGCINGSSSNSRNGANDWATGDGSSQSTDARPQDAGTSEMPSDGGHPGTSVGACGCSSDSTCIAEAEEFVGALASPRTLDWQYLGSACVERDESDRRRCCYARPAVCLCYFGFAGDSVRRDENAAVIGNRDGCDYWGRAQSCLYRSCEFAGCDPTDASTCDAVCEDLVERIRADEDASFDVERRTTYCEQPSCLCRSVYRIGERCYASRAPDAKSYDCSIGDEAILAMEHASGNRGSGGQEGTQLIPDAAPPLCRP